MSAWTPYLEFGLWNAELSDVASGWAGNYHLTSWLETADNNENRQQLHSIKDYTRMVKPIMLYLAYQVALIFTNKDDEYERSTFWRVRCFLAKVTWRLSLLGMLLWTLQCDPEEYYALAYYVLILTLPSSIWACWIIMQRGIYPNILLFISWYRYYRMLALRNCRKDKTLETVSVTDIQNATDLSTAHIQDDTDLPVADIRNDNYLPAADILDDTDLHAVDIRNDNDVSGTDIQHGTDDCALISDKDATEILVKSNINEKQDKPIHEEQDTNVIQDNDIFLIMENLRVTDDKQNSKNTVFTRISPSLESVREDVGGKLAFNGTFIPHLAKKDGIKSDKSSDRDNEDAGSSVDFNFYSNYNTESADFDDSGFEETLEVPTSEAAPLLPAFRFRSVMMKMTHNLSMYKVPIMLVSGSLVSPRLTKMAAELFIMSRIAITAKELFHSERQQAKDRGDGQCTETDCVKSNLFL